MQAGCSGCNSRSSISEDQRHDRAMIRYTRRLASLQTQIDFVTEVGQKAEAFSQDYEGDKAVA
jgi:hypothetical protein